MDTQTVLGILVRLKHMHKRVNPRPWQRQLRAETFVRGLLECQSTQCKSEVWQSESRASSW